MVHSSSLSDAPLTGTHPHNVIAPLVRCSIFSPPALLVSATLLDLHTRLDSHKQMPSTAITAGFLQSLHNSATFPLSSLLALFHSLLRASIYRCSSRAPTVMAPTTSSISCR
eukprot:Gb_24594 [translate_table: standard]